MSKAGKQTYWPLRTSGLLVMALLVSVIAQAQLSLKRQKYDSIATRYKGEDAVYTDRYFKYVIDEEAGEMVVRLAMYDEKLLLTEKSLNTYNDLDVWGTDGYYFLMYEYPIFASLVPDGNDYKRRTLTDGFSHEFAGLKKNSIISVSSNYVITDLRQLGRFYFMEDVPTAVARFDFVAPKSVKMDFLLRGGDTSNVKRTVSEKDGNITYSFVAENMPAIKEYDGVPSHKYYVPHIVPIIKSFRPTGAKKDSTIASDLDAMMKLSYQYVKGRNLKTDTALNNKTAELIKGAYSDREKVRRIYRWVQDNFQYTMTVGGLEGQVPRQADSVFKRKWGDCKDMSSVLMAMCRKAGVAAYFATIGSNNIPYTHEDVASLMLYDHMICAVKLDGKWVFLDGTDHGLPLGENRVDLQGKEAFVMLNDHDYEVVKIPVAPASRTVRTDHMEMNISGNDVTGTIGVNYSGYEAWGMQEAFAAYTREYERDKFVKRLLQRGNQKLEIGKYDVNARTDGDRDVSINARYTLGDYVAHSRGQVYVNMNARHTFEDMYVDDKNRDVAYYHRNKEIIRETVVLNIPRGYHVTHVPKASKGSLKDAWSYEIAYKVDNRAGTVTMSRTFELNTLKIDPAQFEASNKLVDQLNQQYRETVVLTGRPQ